MSSSSPSDLSRRKFVGQCCAAVGATGMLSALSQLRLLGAAANPGSSTAPGTSAAAPDFRAVVCLFLAGGNDANNLIIPNDTAGYAAYAAARSEIALPQSSLLALNPKTTDGRAWGLHPSLSGVHSLFNQGKLAVLGNVGTLAAVTTKAQYSAKSVPLPLQLFSHNDQQVEWMSSVPDKAFSTGWGGRLADLTNAFNENNSISMSISLQGQNSFQVGKNVVQYSVGTTGAVSLTGQSSTVGTTPNYQRTIAQKAMLDAPYSNLFETAFGGMTSNAVTDSAFLAAALAPTPPFTVTFPTSNLGQQLRMIARLIAARASLGLKRQVFFARIGGWDLHDNQVVLGNTATGAHANLFADISNSLSAFYTATEQMGVNNDVTTFTASDFGRTYRTNGKGSDHGWGSHHMVMGGAVKGGDIYGTMPVMTIGGPDDTSSGRWIPTTSVDEYSATIAKWFGVSQADMPVVLPNIGRFAKKDLGFMA